MIIGFSLARARRVPRGLWFAVALGVVATTAFGCASATPSTGAAKPQLPAETGATPAAAPKPEAKPLIATAADGTKIAYEVGGSGPALMLVHGAGETRKSWQERGYLHRLRKQFTVITLDRRGNGDSDRPMTAEAYALEPVLADLLTVADAAGAKRFHLWGFGDGAIIARYLAARSDRVISAVLVGTNMGPAVSGLLKDAIVGMRARWMPLVEAHAAGTLDLNKLTPGDRTAWQGGVAVSALSLGALLEYPPLEPSEIKAPTLWLVGGGDEAAMANVKEYEGKLADTMVTFQPLNGLSYSDSFIKSEAVLPIVEPFLAKAVTDAS